VSELDELILELAAASIRVRREWSTATIVAAVLERGEAPIRLRPWLESLMLRSALAERREREQADLTLITRAAQSAPTGTA
jgi:hypothetical protein